MPRAAWPVVFAAHLAAVVSVAAVDINQIVVLAAPEGSFPFVFCKDSADADDDNDAPIVYQSAEEMSEAEVRA